jgi:hypothetical protein
MFVLAFGLALGCFPVAAQEPSTNKRDIFGVTPGMTVAEAEAAIGGRCDRNGCRSPKFDTSRAAQHEMVLSVTQHLPAQKIHTVYFHFIASDDKAAVLQSLSSRYKVQLGTVCSGIHPDARLAGGLLIQVRCGFGGSYPAGSKNYFVQIIDESLKKLDEDALAAARRLNAPPAPKF